MTKTTPKFQKKKSFKFLTIESSLIMMTIKIGKDNLETKNS